MQGVTISLTIDSHAPQAKITAGADNAYSNLATIRNQYFLKRPRLNVSKRILIMLIMLHKVEGSFDFLVLPTGNTLIAYHRDALERCSLRDISCSALYFPRA